MKEGLLGATLSVSSRSEREEARSHVARWTGSESPEDRRVRALRACRGRRGVRVTAGCRRPAGAGAPRRTPRAAGAGVIESMTGARFVHDRLERLGWDVLIADAA